MRLQGGLGNQLYQYAVGRAVAQHLGRPLLLDKRTIEPEAPARHYDLGAFAVQEHFVSRHQAWCTRWVSSMTFSRAFQRVWLPAREYKMIRESITSYDESIFKRHAGPIILQGYWQSYRYFERCADLIRREFQFKPQADARNQAMMAEMQNTNSVAVHVRRGDYVSNAFFNKTMGVCSMEYYQAGASHIAQNVKSPRYYVFTDDPDWAKKNFNLPGEVQVVDHNLGKADYEDLRLMSSCRHLIIANSSFSWWAAWLAGYPHKIVVAPKQWFQSETWADVDRVPAAWVRL
jgi:hypothetical protein